MTKERREEVVLVALVVSVAIHVALMLLVRSEVMTRSASGLVKPPHRAPMRVVNRVPRPDPAKIEEILDLKAVRDAPAAVGEKAPPSAALETGSAAAVKPPTAEVRNEPPSAPEISPAQFAARPAGLSAAPVVPMTRIETPKMTDASVPAPDFKMSVPAAAKVALPAAPDVSAPSVSALKLDAGRTARGVDFTPASVVYEKVDERIVAEERAAVKDLMNAGRVADLTKFVNVTMSAAESDGWCYFKVKVTPQTDLPIVPKDVVLLIDGSGSIGKDRFGGCRRVAQKIMRSCMNTGDRFNLVVFRNAFSYAFRSWQECTAESFAAGANALNRTSGIANYDFQSETPNGWPKLDDDDNPVWEHSDLKNVAYFYVYELFKKVVKETR